MRIEEILGHFSGVQAQGDREWWALCPVHGDTKPSLHIRDMGDRCSVHCFTCGDNSNDAILKAVGLTFRDLHYDAERKRAYGLTLQAYADGKGLNADWLRQWHVQDGQYRTKNGKTIAGVRMEYRDAYGKVFGVRWRMCLEKGQGAGGKDTRFIWGRKSRMGLYGLWRAGEFPRDYIWLVEGESDCQSLWSAGFPSFGIPGVSNYKSQRDDAMLRMFGKVYVNMEPDSGGKALYKSLVARCGLANICVTRMPPPHKDPAAMWKAAPEKFVALMQEAMRAAVPLAEFQKPEAWGWTEADDEDVRQMKSGARDAREVTSPENGRESEGRPKIDLTAITRAFAETKAIGGALAVRHWREGWYAYDGRAYHHINDSDLNAEIMGFLQDEDVRERFGVQPSIQLMHNVAAGLASVRLGGLPSSLEPDSWIGGEDRPASKMAAMRNLLVDIEQAARYQLALEESDGISDATEVAMFTRAHTPDYFTSHSWDYSYEPDAKCPLFKKFLEDVQPDPEVREMLQMLMGLCLIPDTRYGKFWILFGNGGTGKSTFLRVLKKLVVFVCCVGMLEMLDKFALWPLAENLANIVEELQSDDQFNSLRFTEDRFKNAVTGGDVAVERKGKDRVIAKCTARHVFACNSLPVFSDRSEGIWDRMILVPFDQRIRGQDREVLNYDEVLCEELPGIFNYALAGLAKLRRLDRFPEPAVCRAAKAEHRERCDQEAQWVRENMVQENGAYVEVTKAYKAFRDYLYENGMKSRTSQTFRDAVQRVFGVKALPCSPANRQRVFKGLRLLPEQQWNGGDF